MTESETFRDREWERRLMVAALQDVCFRFSGKPPVFTTDYSTTLKDLALEIHSRRNGPWSFFPALKQAADQIDWKRVQKLADISREIEALGIDEAHIRPLTTEGVLVCLRGVPPCDYRKALRKVLRPSKDSRLRSIRAKFKDAAAIATILGSLANFSEAILHHLPDDAKASFQEDETSVYQAHRPENANHPERAFRTFEKQDGAGYRAENPIGEKPLPQFHEALDLSE